MNTKNEFPIFKNQPNLIYLDSSATTLKPQRVLDKLMEYYTNYSANVHRGLYPISDKATEEYENARKIIADFLKVLPEEIIFTSGTTDGLNFVAESLRKSKLIKENTQVILSELDHHSTLLPLRSISNNVSYLGLNEMAPKIEQSDQECIIGITHVSNVTGGIVDLKEVRKNYPNSIIVVDAAQSVSRLPIDLSNGEIDFLSFSGHKIYGPTGIGILYINKKWHDQLEPYKLGGGMIREVTKDKANWAEAPKKYEAGTPPIAEAIALGEAIKFVSEVGIEKIAEHENKLTALLINELKNLDLEIYHQDNGSSVVSFSKKGIHPHDISQFLGENNICVRAGHHCTQILHKEILEIPASVRVSFGIYNDEEDIKIFIEKLKEAISIFS